MLTEATVRADRPAAMAPSAPAPAAGVNQAAAGRVDIVYREDGLVSLFSVISAVAVPG